MTAPASRLPDYAGGSIVNLMRSLVDACGGPPLAAPPLANPPPALHAALAAVREDRRTLVLLVADGLGADLLQAHGSALLRAACRGTLTSVFPSTTASAIPTFLTGLTPAQHALTGWHLWLDELDETYAILPLVPRAGPPLEAEALAALPQRLFAHAPIFPALPRPSYVVSPRAIAFSPFNRHHARGATVVPYDGLADLVETVASLAAGPPGAYLYVYWSDLDACAHRHGIAGDATLAVLDAFGLACAALAERLDACGARLVLTADHGFIEAPEARCVDLAAHPELAALLVRPLCGERRAAWCYLRPGCARPFTQYVREVLGDAFEAVSRERLLSGPWFGPGLPDPRLATRIGDYGLIALDNWTIKDWLPGEARYRMRGVHGGTSQAEMTVPLVVL